MIELEPNDKKNQNQDFETECIYYLNNNNWNYESSFEEYKIDLKVELDDISKQKDRKKNNKKGCNIF